MLSPQSPLRVRPVSQLAPRPMDWFWHSRLAFGKLAILDGDPGLGKSLLTLDLSARLSTGTPFPDGSPSPGPANSLILNGEDGDEDTVLPRLQALGADLDRVFVWHRNQDDAPLLLPSQFKLLDQALEQTQARFVVIDPIVAFLDPGVLTGSDQSIRRALYPLACLAEKYHCVILLIRHLNKTSSRRSLYRGGGSIGFIGACRSGWLVGPDPANPAHRVLAQVKNNLAPPQLSLSYVLTNQAGAPPTLTWLGPSPWTADQLLAGPNPTPTAAPRDRACDFLLDFLAKGPRTSREVWSAALEQRLAKRTLNRAKSDLEIRSVRVESDGVPLTYWLLPGQHAPVDPDCDLEPWLAPLRERFPPPTPLDDI